MTIFDVSGVQEFDGTSNGVIEIAHDPVYEIPEGTVAFSFVATDTNGEQGLFTKDASGYGGGGNHVALFLEDSTLRLRVQDGQNESYLTFDGITAGQEYEIAFTFSAQGVELWVDGVLVAGDTLVMDWTQNVELIQWGGRGWGSQSGQAGFGAPFEGTIADRRVYDSVLTPTEIETLAGSSSASNLAPDAVDDAVTTSEDTPVVIPVGDLLANDSDPDGGIPVVLGIAGQPANGSASYDAGAGTVTYTPNADFNGADSITVTIGDGAGGTAQSTVNVTVDAVNDAPEAVTDDGNFVVIGESVVIDVLGNDSDPDGDALGVTLVTAGALGTVVDNGDGTITYTATGGTGPDSFTYGVSDGRGGEAVGTVTISVLSEPNAAPVPQDDAYAVDEDAVLTATVGAGVLANDTDANGDVLSVSLVSDVSNGALALNDDGSFTYTPDADFRGIDSFVYEANDGNGSSAQATTMITVDPVNDAPVADDAAFSVSNTAAVDSVVGTVSATDVDGDVLGYQIIAGNDDWTFAISSTGVITLADPTNLDPVGGPSLQLTVEVSDGTDADTATVDITVSDGTVPPPLFESGPHEFDGDVSNAVILAHNPAYLVPEGTLSFTFTADFVDGRRFLFSKDSSGYDMGGHAGIYIEDGKVIARFQDLTTTHVVETGVLVTPGQTHHLAVTFGSAGLIVYVDGVAQGSNSYTGGLVGNEEPMVIGANQWSSGNGVANKLRDGFIGAISETSLHGSAFDAATIGEMSAAVLNDAPIAGDDALLAALNTSLLIDVSADLLTNDSDANGDPLSLTDVTQPTNGTLSDNGDGTWTYTPNTGYVGPDSFTYSIDDGRGGEAVGTVSITVADPDNEAPVAAADTYATPEDAVLTITAAGVLANDTDGDGDLLSVGLVSDVSNGTLALNGGGSFIYTPDANFAGIDTFIYEVSDGRGGTAQATVTITVDSVNDAPTAVADAVSTGEAGAVDIDVLANDSDVDGDVPMVSINTTPGNGAVVVNPDGTVTYTPNAGFLGADQFTYALDDGNGGTATATVTVTVANAYTLSSDDFNDEDLSPIWTFSGIGGTANTETDGTEAWLQIESPADLPVDAYNALTTPRVLQPVSGGDFQVTTRLLNEPAQPYQEHGLLVVESADRWYRFDVAYTTGGLKVLVGDVNGEARDFPYRKTIISGAAEYLRITKTGDQFEFDYSADGVNWTNALTLISDMEPTEVGLFAGSTTYAGSTPGFVSQIDWFETLADPILVEDGSAPIAVDDLLQAQEDQDLAIDVATALLGNDSDPDGEPLTLAGYTQPSSGTLQETALGILTYTPGSGFSGIDTFNYTISDGGFEDTATAQIVVEASGNIAPAAVADLAVGFEDTPLVIDVLGNDTDDDSDGLTILNVGTAQNGSVVVNPDNTVTYTPDADFAGADSFDYTVTDGNGGIATTQVSVDIADVNDPPTVDDATFQLALSAPVGSVVGTVNASDPEGDTLGYLIIGGNANGIFGIDANGQITVADADLLAAAGAADYALQIQVSDGTNNVNATVGVSVTTSPGSPDSDDFSQGSLDPMWSVVGPAGATATVGSDATDAYLELATPDGNYDAWDTNNSARALQAIDDVDFTLEARFLTTPTERYQLQGFLIEDSAGNWLRFDTYSNGSTLFAFAAITENNDSSKVFEMPIPEGTAEYMRLTRSGDLFTFEYSQDGLNWVQAGTMVYAIQVAEVGVFAGNTSKANGYTARLDYFESSTDPITDEDGSISIQNVAPVADDDSLGTFPDTILIINIVDLLSNDSDVNGDPISFESFTQPTNGSLIDNGNGTLTYTPDQGYQGPDSFTYTISDTQLTDDAVVSILVSLPAGDGVSDDFAGGVLDPVWMVEGPVGISTTLGTDPANAYLELSTPDGNYDIWNANNGARVMQTISDGDFLMTTRLLTTPTDKFQIQGFLVEQDADNWLRFDTYSDGENLYAFGGITVSGSSSSGFSVEVPEGEAQYLRLDRAGDLWTFHYSQDGQTWTEAGSITHSLVATKAGVVSGNTAGSTGFTTRIDFIEFANDPIADEDGTHNPPNIAPTPTDDFLVTATDTTFTFSNEALLANDTDPNEDALVVTNVDSPTLGTIQNNGDGTWTFTPQAGFEGSDTLTYTVSDGEFSATAEVSIEIGAPINVWNGATQTFGTPGEGQEWVNILGNVLGDVISLSYTLNGGPSRDLSIGPDTRRLENKGDFNIDIAFSELDGAATDDIIEITAVYSDGTVVSDQVVIEYQSGLSWPKNYSVDWSAVTNIADVVQIVDGQWETTPEGVRPIDVGYDRLLVLGDRDWDNYRLETTVTINDFSSSDSLAGFAVGMLWGGHTTSNGSADSQPLFGYEPGAAFFYTGPSRFKSHSYHDFPELLDVQAADLLEGTTYNLVVQVEQVGVYDRLYSLKFWEEDTAEPIGWTIQGHETFSLEEAPATGSIYLNAHLVDVTFGNLDVTEITGSDIIQGVEGAEVQVAVDTGSALPGLNEIDVFVGAGGADVFVFGDASGTFYDDGIGADAGEDDYGFVYDFVSGTDQVQLAGVAADYVLSTDAPGLSPGTAIWRVGENGDADELIGILNSVYGLDLNGDDFVFTDTLLV